MTTIVRVKRRCEDDPVEALVLACKRKKKEEPTDEPEPFQAVLNFSGTVEKKDDKLAATTVVSYTKKSKAIRSVIKKRVPDITSKHRKEHKIRTEDSRFKVVSCFRGVNVVDGEDEAKSKEDANLTIVDVSLENEDGATEGTTKSSYVYDLYSVNCDDGADINDLYVDNLVSVHPLASDLEYRCGEDYDEEDGEVDPYEEDSNDENNWRNDYPDSDHSISSDEMRLAARLRGFGIDDGYDLSSDSGEEKHLNYGDEDSFQRAAAGLGGPRYAKYKARVMRDLESDDDDDEDEQF